MDLVLKLLVQGEFWKYYLLYYIQCTYTIKRYKSQNIAYALYINQYVAFTVGQKNGHLISYVNYPNPAGSILDI